MVLCVAVVASIASVLAMSVGPRIVGVSPALAELAPLHLLAIDQLLIDGMAIEVRDRLGIGGRGNEARIARFPSLVAIATVAISVVTGLVQVAIAIASTVSLVPSLVS